MRLHGIDFRPVSCASGTRGFFGEGYWYHRPWKFLGLTFEDCGFVAKTTTLRARPGNMTLCDDGVTPREWKPPCIVVPLFKGVVLNAVGLSGPGAPYLAASHRWLRCSGEPFFISFMSVEATASDRLVELREFIPLLRFVKEGSMIKFGLEINFSCPNVGLDPSHLINEVGEALDCAGSLGIPLQCKFNALVPPRAAQAIATHPACSAITMGNTIPWGQLPHRIDWEGLFGTKHSPLARLGGGGLSGWPLLAIHCDWITEARDVGLHKPIWACGGISSIPAIKKVKEAGASGVHIGTAAMLYPGRLRSMIAYANEVFT